MEILPVVEIASAGINNPRGYTSWRLMYHAPVCVVLYGHATNALYWNEHLRFSTMGIQAHGCPIIGTPGDLCPIGSTVSISMCGTEQHF